MAEDILASNSIFPASACDAELEAAMAALPRPRVFTNGVFDLLHRGHCAMLCNARRLGGSMVVGINSDASARRLGKGPGRPINTAEDRAAVLISLACVDLVFIFDEATPCALLERLRPEIYVKGADYDVAALEESRTMKRWGGRSVALPLVAGLSTSRIVERIVAADERPQGRAGGPPRPPRGDEKTWGGPASSHEHPPGAAS